MKDYKSTPSCSISRAEASNASSSERVKSAAILKPGKPEYLIFAEKEKIVKDFLSEHRPTITHTHTPSPHLSHHFRPTNTHTATVL